MPAIYQTPATDLEDLSVVEEIGVLRESLAGVLRIPRRWRSGLRRTTQARAIQGSNTIEGYTVSEQDAVAAIDDEPPLTADQRTWSEILGYRRPPHAGSDAPAPVQRGRPHLASARRDRREARGPRADG